LHVQAVQLQHAATVRAVTGATSVVHRKSRFKGPATCYYPLYSMHCYARYMLPYLISIEDDLSCCAGRGCTIPVCHS
jgi:hypothetical protein